MSLSRQKRDKECHSGNQKIKKEKSKGRKIKITGSTPISDLHSSEEIMDLDNSIKTIKEEISDENPGIKNDDKMKFNLSSPMDWVPFFEKANNLSEKLDKISSNKEDVGKISELKKYFAGIIEKIGNFDFDRDSNLVQLFTSLVDENAVKLIKIFGEFCESNIFYDEKINEIKESYSKCSEKVDCLETENTELRKMINEFKEKDFEGKIREQELKFKTDREFSLLDEELKNVKKEMEEKDRTIKGQENFIKNLENKYDRNDLDSSNKVIELEGNIKAKDNDNEIDKYKVTLGEKNEIILKLENEIKLKDCYLKGRLDENYAYYNIFMKEYTNLHKFNAKNEVTIKNLKEIINSKNNNDKVENDNENLYSEMVKKGAGVYDNKIVNKTGDINKRIPNNPPIANPPFEKEKEFVQVQRKKKDPKIIIYNVEDKMVISQFFKLLINSNDYLDNNNVKVLFSFKGKKGTNWVIGVKPEVYKLLCNIELIFIGNRGYSHREFFPVKQCILCGELGHLSKECPGSRCLNCGDLHHYAEDCRHPTSCVNCLESNFKFHKNYSIYHDCHDKARCQSYKGLLNSKRRYTRYS